MAPGADERIPSTIRPEEAAAHLWDALVIGAGPAGAVAAALLARRGLAVLLVERYTLPRDKVCGGCVGAAAVQALLAAGLDVSTGLREAPRLDRAVLLDRGRRVDVALPGGIAVPRSRLDGWLVRRAIGAGAQLLTAASAVSTASTASRRDVTIRTQDGTARLEARVVVLAAGLAPRLEGDACGIDVRVARCPLMGVSATTPVPPFAGAPEPGQIVMACGRHGYVGVTMIEEGRLNLAGALDPAFIRAMGGPEDAVRATLSDAGAPSPNLAGLHWRGTPALRRAPARVALRRLLLVGDAAGYVEPFTGEGIGWAVAGAVAAADVVEAGVRNWTARLESEWTRRHRQVIGARQGFCGAVCLALRRKQLRRAGFLVAGRAPAMTQAVTAHLQRPFAFPVRPTPIVSDRPAPLLPATL